MLRNKVFLETDEYDIYMFPIPETILKGKKFLCTVFPRKSLKQWVFSWMEKLHPCFDGRFINDIKVYKENGQIMALVTVAQKIQIASHLVKKRTAVYVHRPYKRRVFAEKSPVRKLLVIPALAFTIALAVLSGFSGHGGSVAASKESFSAPHDESVAVSADVASDVVTASKQEEPAALCLPETSDPVLCADTKTAFCESEQLPEPPEIAETAEKNEITESPEIIEMQAAEETPEPTLVSVEQPDYAKSEETTEPPETEELPELSEPPTPPLPTLSEPQFFTLSEPPFLDDFLSLIFKAGSTLSSFRWQTSPSASATLTLEGCFPEDVYNCIETLCGELSSGGSQFAETAVFPLLSFSSISYKDNIPSFSLTIDYSSFDLAHAEPRQEQAKTSVPATFRQLIVETGGKVTSEGIKPPFISGFVPASLLDALSEKVAEHFTESPACGISDVAFNITSASPLTEPEKASILIRAEFSNEKPVFFPLERIASIYPNDKEPLPSAQEQSATLTVVQIHDAVEIGSVCMEDGTYISFYRKRDGKIIKGDPYEKQKEP